MNEQRYFVCGCTPWARRVYEERLKRLPGEWEYCSDASILLHVALTNTWNTIFFLHWRSKVPSSVLRATSCIGFHLGQLPQERGGTPLQWRILDGQRASVVTMFELTEELDAGDVLASEPVALYGTAEECYGRMMDTAAGLIAEYVHNGPRYRRPQLGIAKVYPRRTAPESLLQAQHGLTLEQVYDRIRCVDAEGYPHAYLDYEGLRYTFRRAVRYDGRIEADVTITEQP